jgi:hypothetical protein
LADPVTYQRITLTLEHPWNYAGEDMHRWSVKFNLSGGQALLDNEIEPTVVDLFEPFGLICRTGGHLAEARYYPPEGHAATWFKLYTPADHPTAGAGYTPATFYEQQLEVCALARAPIGKSATGKPVFLRKWIHAVRSETDPNVFANPNNAPTGGVLRKWNDGSGPRLVVPVDPTGGTQGGPWALETHLFTHQLRRGPKRKKTTSTVYVPVPVP